MNKAKGRQHSRKAARRAALRLKRGQKNNAKKIDRERRILKSMKNPHAFKHSRRYVTPSDLRRRAKRLKKFAEQTTTVEVAS